jgi:excisionase family DNA binding protein
MLTRNGRIAVSSVSAATATWDAVPTAVAARTRSPARLGDADASGARALLGGVSRPHIYRLIARGELRTIKSGARRLVPVAAIDEYLADRESQSA